MTLFIILFLLIVGVSVYLAYLSMKDFYDIPETESFSLFLIRNPKAFSLQILKDFHSSGSIISLERLFKGDRSALVIFGPKSRLALFPDLNLLELEDYTKVNRKMIAAQELKETPNIPSLGDDEQFWFQLVLRAHSDKFRAQMRTILVSPDPAKRDVSEESLDAFRDYQKRKIAPLKKDTLEFSPEELLPIILPPQ